MTTGQYPKRRETDEQAAERVKALQERQAQLPEPYPIPLVGFMTRLDFDRSNLRNVLHRSRKRNKWRKGQK